MAKKISRKQTENNELIQNCIKLTFAPHSLSSTVHKWSFRISLLSIVGEGWIAREYHVVPIKTVEIALLDQTGIKIDNVITQKEENTI